MPVLRTGISPGRNSMLGRTLSDTYKGEGANYVAYFSLCVVTAGTLQGR